MSVVALRQAPELVSPASFMPAIRTPDQFRAACRRVDGLRAEIAEGDLNDCWDAVNEIQTLRQAMDASPYRLENNIIVSRGFSARVVSRAN